MEQRRAQGTGSYYADLYDISNQTTSIDLGFDVAPGTDSYNGPTNAVDAAALGLLGGAPEAVNDFYITSAFQLQGLDHHHHPRHPQG